MTKKSSKHTRPSWDEYFLNIMDAVAQRSTCDRGRSAAVIVRDKRLLVTGYAGAPSGVPHCDEVGHDIHEVVHEDGTRTKHCIRTTHAEQNALAQAAGSGVSIAGGTVYANMESCYVCAKMIANAGIKRYVCRKRYHGAKKTRELFEMVGIELVVLEDDLETYDEM